MLSEAKDTSELMVDLGYAALFFADERMAAEVLELEERLERSRPRDARRSACSPRARPRDAEQHVERAARRLRDRAHGERRGRHRAHRHPPARDPGRARRRPRRGRGGLTPGPRPCRAPRSRDRSLADVELPVEVGMRVVAIRRGQDVDHRPRRRRAAARPTTSSSCAARPRGSTSCGSSPARPSGVRRTVEEDPTITDLDRAVDVLVEMKNVSEVAVGLAYSSAAVQRPEPRGRGEPARGPARRDA